MTWPVPGREDRVRAGSWYTLPTIVLANDVGDLMTEVIKSVSLPPIVDAQDESTDPERTRLIALYFMTIFGFRAIRAAIAVMSVGYTEQAVSHNRLLDELHNRAQKISEDKSGDLARQWLDGRWNPKGAKLAGRDLWDMMSAPAHAGVRGILDWIAVSQEDGTTGMVVGPEQRPEVANAMLAYMMGEGRDLAVMLAKANGKTLSLTALDARLAEAHDRFLPEKHGDGGGKNEKTKQ
jgi:hypothetical protein